MRVLVTGGGGFLGSHLSEAWLGRGDEVTVLVPAPDLKIRHLRANPKFRVIRESVLERAILEGLVAWADLVYHLLVLLESKSVPLADILAELESRMGTSGLAEKAAREAKPQ